MSSSQWPSKTMGALHRKRIRQRDGKFRSEWKRWSKGFLKSKGYITTPQIK